MVFIRCGFFKYLKYLNLKAEFADVNTVQETISANLGIPTDYISVFYNGKHADSNQRIPNDSSIDICFRLPGGKGGFGSMLRAIGAQIEKTTNREACRDLSGRRLRDINEEQRLKRWLAKKAEREADQLRRRKERLERLKELPKHEFHDPEYNKQRSELPERIDEALNEGLKKASSLGKRKASSSKRICEPPVKKDRLWLDDDDDVLSDSDTSDQELSPNSDSQTGENSQTNLVDSSDSKEAESSKSPTHTDTPIDNSQLKATVVAIPCSSKSKDKGKSKSVIPHATIRSNDETEAMAVDVSCSPRTENGQENAESASCNKPEVLQNIAAESPADIKQYNQTTEDSINKPTKTDTKGTVITEPPSVSENEKPTLSVKEKLTLSVNEKPTMSENEKPTVSENEKQTEDDGVVDLMTFKSPAALESLGMERLKTVLMHMGLKCGGTLTERAQRLWLVLGLDPKDYPQYLRAKAKKK